MFQLLSLPQFLLGSLLLKELVLVFNKLVDVSDFFLVILFFIVFVIFVLLLNYLVSVLIVHWNLFCHIHSLFLLVFLGVDNGCKTALLEFFHLLLVLGLSDLFFLFALLVFNTLLGIFNIEFGFVYLIDLVLKNVLLWDHKVGSLFVVELLHKLVVRFFEVLGALYLVLLQVDLLVILAVLLILVLFEFLVRFRLWIVIISCSTLVGSQVFLAA